MMSHLILPYEIIAWGIRLVMLVVVPYHRKPVSAMAWLLIIFFLPIPGLILFLLVGGYRLPRRRIQRHRELLQAIKSARRDSAARPHIAGPELGKEMNSTFALAKSLGDFPILGGNDLELLTETDEVIARIIADIDAAQRHVHMLFYIFADDETGRRVADALARAVRRGVTCRVLVDAVASRRMVRTLGPKMKEDGILLREAMPVGLFRRRMARIDLRNHRKLVVIDGRLGYTGSQNIVNADYGRGGLRWTDLMVRLAGPTVLELQGVFLSDWGFETREILDDEDVYPTLARKGSVPAQTLPSGPNYPTDNYQRLLVAALYEAREQVVLTTPYFVPDEPFMQALEVAVRRGVKVDLIVPEHCDQIVVGAASRAYYDDLIAVGVNIHLYQPGLLHSKTMSIDRALALIGTGNFDIRSFTLDFEVNLICYGREVTDKLREVQDRYVRDSVSLDPLAWKQRPMIRRLAQNMAKLFSPVL
jgi:cardiolipin synthase